MKVFKQFGTICLFLLSVWMFSGCSGKDKEVKQFHTIALITDFGEKDAYVSQMKGVIKTINPPVQVMDLNHHIPPFDIASASYFVEKATRYFPAGTIVVVVIDPGVGTDRKGIALRTNDGKIYIAPDNGVLTHVMYKQGVRGAREIQNKKFFFKEKPSSTFHGRDIFASAAAYLSLGKSMDDLGPEVNSFEKVNIEESTVLGNQITGSVIHIDQFGNIMTNIHPEDVASVKDDQLIKVTIGYKKASVPLLKTYGEAPRKRLMSLINSDREFEIAKPEGNAAEELKAKVGDRVTLKF